MSIKEKLKTNFPQFEDDLVDSIEKHCSIRTFKAGEAIIRFGQYMKSTMLIISGKVKIYTEGEEGEEFFMYFLEPGQACAMSFICAARNKKSDLEAFATEDTEAIMVPIEVMDTFMVKYKSWYYFVVESYRNRYQELLDALRSVAFNAMDERLEYYLMKLKNSQQSNLLSLTHEQIARDLNSSRVVISRLLKQMEIAGKVKLHRNTIELLSAKHHSM